MLKYSIATILCFLSIQTSLLAQNISNNHKITAPAGAFSTNPKDAKVESNLITLYNESQRPSFRSTTIPALQYITIDAIAKDDTQQLLKDLQALGLENGKVYGRMVSGRISIEAVEEINLLKSLLFARQALGESGSGRVNTQGDEALQSQKVRSELCFDGTGVKVGVLSDSYNKLNGAAQGVATGDLPGKQNPYGYQNPVEVLEEYFFGEDEGRAMLEIVHDIAPGAELAFHTSRGGQSGFANGIRELAKAGCDIIIDDWKYFAEPFFQDGIIAQAVDEVSAQGVTYLTSAGNQARLSYEKKFQPKTVKVNGDKVIAHDFKNGDVFQQIIVPPGRTMTLSLQWTDRYASVKPGAPGAETDIDVYLLDQFTSEVLVQSIDNNLGSDPVELISYTNNTSTFKGLNVLITKYRGPSPELIKYVIYNQTSSAIIDEYHTKSPTIIGHSNAASAITVGAAFFRNTPAFGSPTPIIESFSSAGGVPIFYDLDGNYQKGVIRNKPEITAPDGGNTSFFGFDSDLDGHPNFYGTSAAAPHAAGVVALMLEATNKQLTPAEISQVMQSTAIRMKDPSTSGAGLVQADKAVEAVATYNKCITYAAEVVRFKLIDADADKPLGRLKDGDVIDLNEINNVPINIQAVVEPKKAGSVELILDGPLSFRQTENVMPYALFGDNPAFQFYGERLPTGSYTLTALPHSEPDLQGEGGIAQVIHFEVVANYALTRFSLIDADTDEEMGALHDGDVLNLSSGKKINIRAHPSTETVGSVRFVLQGPVNEKQIENVVPYALFGDSPPYDYRGKPLPAGYYTLKAIPFSEAKAEGMKGTPLDISFEVTDDKSTIASQKLQQDTPSASVKGNFRVFPVPASDRLNIVHEMDENKSFKAVLYDELTGRVVVSRAIDGQKEVILPLQQHPMGNYILKIISQDDVHTFRIFKQ